MRNLKLMIATLVVITSFSACTKTEQNIMSLSEAASVIPGTYKVNFYGDTFGTDGIYQDYTFQFNSNGTVSATFEGNVYDGIWLIQSTVDELYDQELSMTISGTPELDALNHMWMVMEVTDVTLHLTDELRVEEIHFIKI